MISKSSKSLLSKIFFKITASSFLLIFLGAFCFVFNISAQQDVPPEVMPPPLKFISKEEKKLLEAETDVKSRTKLALTLIDAKLKEAEVFGTQQKYREMFEKLGNFHALVDHTLDFLDRNDNGRGKVLNNFKRFEMSLRTYLTRIELIRRDLPLEYEFYVKNLGRYIRNARAKAIEPFFSETIVPNNKNNLKR
ncbi:MAG: hypothetical protein WKF90_16555 [Pyrinomonadaceae bacterium]